MARGVRALARPRRPGGVDDIHRERAALRQCARLARRSAEAGVVAAVVDVHDDGAVARG